MTHAKGQGTSRVSSGPAYLHRHFAPFIVPLSRARSILVVGLLSVSTARAVAAQATPYRDARLPTADRVRDLLGRMTLEEKFWQLYMIPGDLDDSTHDYSHGIFGLQLDPQRAARAPKAPGGSWSSGNPMLSTLTPVSCS